MTDQGTLLKEEIDDLVDGPDMFGEIDSTWLEITPEIMP
jgi:hypothetical protein